MDAIRLKNISKNFGSLPVLKNINLTVEEGSFVSIIGASGCGKTTLLKTIGGLVKPSTGEIKIKNDSVEKALKRRDFGFVFQDPVLLPWRNVLKNLALPLEIIGNEAPLAESEKMLQLVGLTDFKNYYPSKLSGGMKQRVAIARSLAFNPDILLLDEPFGALDELTRERLNLELLRIWGKTHKTIIFITHSIPEAVFLSQRVIVLSGSPAKILAAVDIDLPYPRTNETKESKKYFEYIKWLRNQLEKS